MVERRIRLCALALAVAGAAWGLACAMGLDGGGGAVPADVVGWLEARIELRHSAPGVDPPTRRVVVAASFVLPIDGDDDAAIERFGACEVMTETVTVDPDRTATDVFGPDGPTVLDPGAAGRADNGVAELTLPRGDPSSVDPPDARLAGLFQPADDVDPSTLGFDADQSVTFRFPGGADIGAFEANVAVPTWLELTAPNLDDPDLTLDVGLPLELAWTPGDPAGTVTVEVFAAGQIQPTETDGPLILTRTSVKLVCQYTDAGSGRVDASLLSRLPADAAVATIRVYRQNESEARVSLAVSSSEGIVQVVGRTEVVRTLPIAGESPFPGS